MTNEFFLSQSSDLASITDGAVCNDLLDTLAFHKDRCVGMAANMIGVRKRIIVFDDSGKHRVMKVNMKPKKAVYPLKVQEKLAVINV